MFAGIDVGSLTAKAVLINHDGLVDSFVKETGDNPKKSGKEVLDAVLQKTGVDPRDIRLSVGTGYGRVSLTFVDKTVTELTCHARGAFYLNPEVRTVIDIGGQDSKVINLAPDGAMSDFVMNDRCAAGTGRFLEVMAGALKIDLEDLGEVSLSAEQPCEINNTCTVFAESEVISLLASGCRKADIIAGLHKGIAKRVGSMAQRLGVKEELVFAGGVAKNFGLRHAIESFLGIQFSFVGDNPQIIGALGAALIARDLYMKRESRM